MNKVERKVRRIVGGRVFNHHVDGANEFMKFACEQGFRYRFSIAISILSGKPLKLRKVVK